MGSLQEVQFAGSLLQVLHPAPPQTLGMPSTLLDPVLMEN